MSADPSLLSIRDVTRLAAIVLASQHGTRVRFLVKPSEGEEPILVAGVARNIDWDSQDLRDGVLIVNDGYSDVPVPIADIIASGDGAFDAGLRVEAIHA